MQVRAVPQGGQQRAEGGGDLREQPGREDVGEVGDAEGALAGEDGGEGFGGGDAEGVAVEPDFGDGGRGVEQGCEVRFDGGGGVELEGLVGEGEDVGFAACHGGFRVCV